MALTVTQKGSGNSILSGTTVTVVPSANLAGGGGKAVLFVAADNNPDTGGNFVSVTDTKGNNWVQRETGVFDPDVANAGVEGAIYDTTQSGGTLTTSDTITVTFTNAITSKAAILYEVTGTKRPTYADGAFGTGSNTNAPTITTATLTNGDAVIAGAFAENNGTYTDDGDTTNGIWSAGTFAEADTLTLATSISVFCQSKIVTATATQTFNPTQVLAVDQILGWISFREEETVGITAGLIGAFV